MYPGEGAAYVIGAGVPLLPLHQEELSHHQGGDQDEDHLGVHGLVAAVLGMHPSVFDPGTRAEQVSLSHTHGLCSSCISRKHRGCLAASHLHGKLDSARRQGSRWVGVSWAAGNMEFGTVRLHTFHFLRFQAYVKEGGLLKLQKLNPSKAES